MSSLWRKFKDSSKPDETLNKQSTSSKCVLVRKTDEEFYLKNKVNGKSDPLLVKTQIIKSFKTVLRDSPALPYFLEFLQSQEAEYYALCWMECEKFRQLAQSLISNSFNSNEKSFDASCDINSSVLTVNTFNTTLPDLVSNIPKNAPVTPLSSPDEDNCKSTQESSIIKVSAQESINDNTSSLHRLSFASDNNGNERVQNDPTCLQRLKCLGRHISETYLSSESNKYIPLSSNISYYYSDTSVDENCIYFTQLQKEIYNYLEAQYFQKFLESEFFLKYEIDVFTSQNITFLDLISSGSALPYLMEFMEQEGGQPLMEFWISAFNFREHLQRCQADKNYNCDQAQADAMILYDKYFSLQATHSLGFSDETRFLVESNICQEGGPSHHCFDTPLRIILHIIQRDYLAGYISSTLHIKYVSELVSNLKMSAYARKKHSESGSTCDSGRPISRSNTLLAMDTSAGAARGEFRKKCAKSLDEASMRIDAKQLLDPDSLWRRNNFTKLSCGFVDEFGRFESDLQPEPDKKSSKFSQTLKKFAKIEEQKTKEEMAYKVAQMIVNDVTNVTLGPQARLTRSVSEIFHQRPHSIPSDKTSLSSFQFLNPE